MPCPHGRPPAGPRPPSNLQQVSTNKQGGGSSLCKHGRQRSKCKDCGGKGICEHERERRLCKECGGDAIILDATEVEEFSGEEAPDEGLNKVHAWSGPRRQTKTLHA